MKKIIIVNLLALFVATGAFAATITLDLTKTGLTVYGAKTGVTITPGAAGTTVIGKSSTGVSVGLNSVDTGYSVQTQHKNGTKSYGTSYDSTAIFVKDVEKGVADTSGTSDPDSTGFLTTGWSSM